MAELFEEMLELTPTTLPGFRASLWKEKCRADFRVEFGAGFLPPETDASKGPDDDVSGRDRKSETTTTDKWPKKRPFCLRAISCGFLRTRARPLIKGR